jgi:hypothetical protein
VKRRVAKKILKSYLFGGSLRHTLDQIDAAFDMMHPIPGRLDEPNVISVSKDGTSGMSVPAIFVLRYPKAYQKWWSPVERLMERLDRVYALQGEQNV